MVKVNHTSTIRVTSDTTLSDLKQFAQKTNNTEKLRGKLNDDGSITLYASTGKSSIFSKISGNAREKSEFARDAISMVMRNTMESNVDLLGDIGKMSDLFMREKGSSMKSGTLAQILSLTETYKPESPRLSMLPDGGAGAGEYLTAIADNVFSMAKGGGYSDVDPDLNGDIKHLAQHLAKSLLDDGLVDDFPDIVFSSAPELKDDILKQLKEKVGTKTANELGYELGQIANKIIDKTLQLLSPAQFVGPDTLSIGGKLYDRDKLLGEGAFGSVYSFTPQLGGDSIAVKFANADDEDMAGQENLKEVAKENMLKEVKAHALSQGDGHANVLTCHGIGRQDDGSIFIVMDIASNGGADNAIQKMQDLESEGIVTPGETLLAKLTLIKDMANGLNAVHQNGMAHIDFKPGNVFIDENGMGKVADFGNSGATNKSAYKGFKVVDTAFWLAPEVIKAKASEKDTMAPLKPQVSGLAMQRLNTMFLNEELHKGGVAPQGQVDIEKVLYDKVDAHILDSVLQENVYGGKTDAQKNDAFALGVCMFNTIFGGSFILGEMSSFDTENEKALLKFYEKGIDPIGDHPGALKESTGNLELDKLINGLMKPNPRERMSLDQVVSSPLFSDPKIGSTDSRNLLNALIGGDPEQIRTALDRLD